MIFPPFDAMGRLVGPFWVLYSEFSPCYDASPMTLPKGALPLAVKLATRSGAFLKKHFGRHHAYDFKWGEGNLVTKLDRTSERMILKGLRRAFPDHEIVAEESAARRTGSPWRWHVDPLDGTTNYAHTYPVYCVSIGLEHDGRVELGVVYNPNLDELFVATRGGGATRNRRRIRVSTVDRLRDGMLATGFSYDPIQKRRNMTYFRRFMKTTRAIRRAGAAALDLCYVAAGVFDGFWEFDLGTWDIAAGMLMVEEAGGALSDFAGRPVDLRVGEVLASNGRVHRDMVRVLKPRA